MNKTLEKDLFSYTQVFVESENRKCSENENRKMKKKEVQN